MTKAQIFRAVLAVTCFGSALFLMLREGAESPETWVPLYGGLVLVGLILLISAIVPIRAVGNHTPPGPKLVKRRPTERKRY